MTVIVARVEWRPPASTASTPTTFALTLQLRPGAVARVVVEMDEGRYVAAAPMTFGELLEVDGIRAGGGGAVPSIKLGRRILVPIRPLAEMLGLSLYELQVDLGKVRHPRAGRTVVTPQGRPLKDAAAGANITFKSGRTYLDRIFAKTGTHQQSELVALLKSAERIAKPGP